MKRYIVLFGICLSGLMALGQKITEEKVFPVSYPIQRIGYPVKIVPNTGGSFVYLEYWPDNGEKKVPGMYIQSYGADYKEQWSHPVVKEGLPAFREITDLVRFDNSFGVIGSQYSPSAKRDQIKMQLFSLDGQSMGGMQTVSSYTKKDKNDFEDQFAYSGDHSKMLWVGHNATASAKKREVLASVWGSQGDKVWSKRLFLPQLEASNYYVKQSTVDNRGNAYFLLVSAEMTNTEKDTAFKPMVVRYDHREGKYTEHRLKFPAASVQEGRIHITERNELAFLGILSDGSGTGFMNGAKRFETPLSWDKIVFQLFNIERELQLKSDYTMDFPAEWVKRYQERGANFSQTEIVEDKGKLYWVLEEHFTQVHNGQQQFLYYDVATIAVNRESGEAEWATTFEKKQRDYNSGRLLSYVRAMSGGQLHFLYLNERGAQGMVVCTSISLSDGTVSRKNLAKNDRATYLFFPARSAQIASKKVLLMGVGNPVGDDYKFIEVSFE